MKILITGANGQLGKDLVKILEVNHEVLGCSRDLLDVTNLDQCKQVITDFHPEAIIHAAAYTNVDLAETEQDIAFQINATGSRNIAVAAERIGAKLCYVSTDYVFDGNSPLPYNEYDQTNPVGIYGKSKRAGEYVVQTLSTRYYIVRTSWLYGQYGHNFVKTMLRLSYDKDRLTVVHDQIGSPTYTVDLCHFLNELIQTEKYGIYHASNTGTCTWYEFAKTIFKESGISVQLHPCTTEEFPRPAPRPKYSVLDHMSIRTNNFQEFRHWNDALRSFLNVLKESSQ